MSGVAEIVFEELVIPLLLIPIYLGVFFARRNEYRALLEEIHFVKTLATLHEIELKVNQKVKERKIRVYHGLVLRNAIEAVESQLGGEFGQEE
jgi:hypothetical protein